MTEEESGNAEREGYEQGYDKGGQTYVRLRDLLLYNRFPPNVQINIKDVADELGVSTTPVREALIRLAVEGIVTSIANKGFHTRPLLVRELLAEYELALIVLRYGVLNYGAAFNENGIGVPPNLPPDRNAAFAAALAELAQAQASYMGAVFEQIATLSGNNSVVAVIRRFNDRVQYVRELDLQLPERLPEVHTHMNELVGYLKNGDANTADFHLVQLFDESAANLYELVKEANMRALVGEF